MPCGREKRKEKGSRGKDLKIRARRDRGGRDGRRKEKKEEGNGKSPCPELSSMSMVLTTTTIWKE